MPVHISVHGQYGIGSSIEKRHGGDHCAVMVDNLQYDVAQGQGIHRKHLSGELVGGDQCFPVRNGRVGKIDTVTVERDSGRIFGDENRTLA